VSVGGQVDATAGTRRHPGTAVVRGGALSFVGGLVAAAGGFLLTLVVTRGLGAERSGVFFVSIGLFTILSNILELGADTGLVRSVPRLRTLHRTADLPRTVIAAVVPVALAGSAAAILVAAFAPTLARVFMQQGSTVLGAGFLRSVAPFLIVAPLATVLIAGTRGFGRIVPYVAIQNVGLPLARPLIVGLLVAAGATGDRAIAVGWGIPWAVAAAAAGIVVVHLTNLALRTDDSMEAARPFRVVGSEFWSFASARAFGGAAEILLVWLDVLLVGWLVGPVEAGIYAAASRFVTTGTLALSASRIAITPRLAHLMTAGKTDEAEQLFNGGTQAVVATSWPLYLGLACFSPAILRLFGPDFTAGATALTILSIAMLVDTATGNVGSVLLMAGSSRWNLFNATTALVVNVVADLILIPDHGATGAAIGWSLAIVTLNVLACLEVHYLMRLRIFTASVGRTAIATLICFGVPGIVLGVLAAHKLAALVTWLLVGSVAYSAWWWRRRGDPEVAVLLDALGVDRARVRLEGGRGAGS